MSSVPVNLNKPKDHQEFERCSRVLVACHFNDDLAQLNGRSGQKQAGVDIVCYENGDSAHVIGIQCKLMGSKLTKKILDEEVNKAKNFVPTLKKLIIATSAQRDAILQEKARLLTEALRASTTPFTITIWFWEDIEQYVSNYPEAILVFDPTHNSFAAETYKELLSLSEKIDEISVMSSSKIFLDNNKNTELNGQITAYCKDVENKSKVVIEENIKNLKELKLTKWHDAQPLEKYRLLTALAKCHEILGYFDISRNLIEDAHSEHPTHPNAKINLAGSLILQGKHDEANKIVADILHVDFKNEDAAGLLIHSKLNDKKCDNPLNLINPDIINSASVQLNYVFFLRYRNDIAWVEAAKNAYQKFPKNNTLKQFYYEGVLSSFMTKHLDYVLGAFVEQEAINDFIEAVTFLKQEALSVIEKKTFLCSSLACNSVLGIDYLFQDYETANSILDYAAECNPNCSDIEHHKIMVSLSHNSKKIDFMAFLAKETDSKRFNSLKFQILMKQNRFDEAMVIAKSIPLEDFEIKLIKVYSFIEAKDINNAKALLLELISQLPEDTKLSRRLQFAKIAEKLNLFQEVVDLLAGYVDVSRHSESLEILAFVAFSHKLLYAEELLNELSPEVLIKKYYHQLKVGYLYNIDSPNSIAEIENYLSVYHDDFDMRFRLWGLLTIYNQADNIKSDIESILANNYENVEFELRIAQYLAIWMMKFDFIGEALALGYKTLLNNWQKEEAHQLYFALFFHFGLNKLDNFIAGSDTVQEGYVVTVQSEKGEEQRFRFETNDFSNFKETRISPIHDIWHLLFDKKLNEIVEFGHFSKISYKITEIKHVYIDAIHNSPKNAEVMFPNQKYFQSFSMDMSKEDPIEDFINFMKESNKHSEALYKKFEDFYYVRQLPLNFCSQFLGSDIIDIYEKLVLNKKEIRVALGTHQEFLQALKSIDDLRGKSCVLDAITLKIVKKYEILPVLKSFFKSIYTPQSVIRFFLERKEKLEQFANKEHIMSYGDGDKIGLLKFTPEDNKNIFDAANEDYLWVLENVKPISILPTGAINKLDYFKNGEADSILAAQSHNHFLISEDCSYRMIAAEVCKVQSAWLQPLLILALEDGSITLALYNKIIVDMVLNNHSFIGIDAECLFYQAEEDDFRLSENLKLLFNTIITNIAPNGFINYQNLLVLSQFLNKLIALKIDFVAIKIIACEIYALLKQHDTFYKYSLSFLAKQFLDENFIFHVQAWYDLHKYVMIDY